MSTFILTTETELKMRNYNGEDDFGYIEKKILDFNPKKCLLHSLHEIKFLGGIIWISNASYHMYIIIHSVTLRL